MSVPDELMEYSQLSVQEEPKDEVKQQQQKQAVNAMPARSEQPASPEKPEPLKTYKSAGGIQVSGVDKVERLSDRKEDYTPGGTAMKSSAVARREEEWGR